MIFPEAMWWIVIPSTDTFLFVAGIAIKSPLWVPEKVEQATTLLFIVLGNGVLDGEVQIRVACEEEQNLALVRFGAYGSTRNIGGMESVAGRNDFAHNSKLPFVPDFSIEAPHDGLVIG